MSTTIKTFTRTVLVTMALSVAALSLPAFAGGSDESFIRKDDHKCQSVQKAKKSLKKWDYKHVEYEGKLSKDKNVYIFLADQKNNEGHYISWAVYYDSCEREVVGRDIIKKQAEEGGGTKM